MNLLYIHKWHPEYLSNYYNFSNQHNEKYTNRLATFSLVKAWVWVGGCSTPCVSKLLGYTDPKKTVVLSAFTVRNILWVGWGEEVLLEREELEGVYLGEVFAPSARLFHPDLESKQSVTTMFLKKILGTQNNFHFWNYTYYIKQSPYTFYHE